MAATDILFRSAATDVVALLRKSSFQPVATRARAMRATIREAARTMDHPVEDGSTITDHRVVLPVEVEVSVVLAGADYRQTYQELKTLFRSAEPLIVQTATDSYGDMVVTDMPHDESPDMVGAVAMTLKLREIKLVRPSLGTLTMDAVADPADAGTIPRGEVAATAAQPAHLDQARAALMGEAE